MRKLTRIFVLILVPAFLATAYLATASAAPTTDPENQPLQVYGERSWPLQRAIAYWNDLAGRELIHYAGSRVNLAAANDSNTVVIGFDELTTSSGQTAGGSGRKPQAITIDARSMFQPDVYAHQLGVALDIHHEHRR